MTPIASLFVSHGLSYGSENCAQEFPCIILLEQWRRRWWWQFLRCRRIDRVRRVSNRGEKEPESNAHALFADAWREFSFSYAAFRHPICSMHEAKLPSINIFLLIGEVFDGYILHAAGKLSFARSLFCFARIVKGHENQQHFAGREKEQDRAVYVENSTEWSRD